MSVVAPAVTQARFNTRYGPFQLMAFQFPSGATHAALVRGDLAAEEHPLVRVQSSCVTGTALAAVGCDCGEQLEQSLHMVAERGSGIVLYLFQEGMGHGLLEKVAHFREMNDGADTYEAAVRRGVDPDVRDYDETAVILHHLIGDRSIRLLTNNPEKMRRLEAAGVHVFERVPNETEPTDANRAYLQVKKHKLGHLLTRV